MTNEKKDFDSALIEWLRLAQGIVTAHHIEGDRYGSTPVLSISVGRRYVKVIRQQKETSCRSVHCFVDKTNGDVLKAANWKAPAKHARGSIYTEELGVGPYGADYMCR